MTATATRQERPNLTKTYRFQAPDLQLDTQEFRATLIRGDYGNIPVDGLIDSVEWRYYQGDPVLHGAVDFATPKAGRAIYDYRVHDGHVLKMDVRWGGAWRELWRMRLRDGQRNLTGGFSFEMHDDLALLQENIFDWHFVKSEKQGKPKGWLCHEIAQEVARRLKIPLGKIAKGKHHITDIDGEMSALAVLQRAYAIERRGSGRRFVMRWNSGKLDIVPLRRNPMLNILGPQILDATIGREPRDEQFATAVTIRATVKTKGRKTQKLVLKYVDKKAVAKEGFVHRPITGSDVKSRADLERKAKRFIAKHGQRKRTITGLQHQGIAFIRRGDAQWVSLPEYGFHGKHGICFVAAGVWSISGGSFTMSLDLGFDDPFVTETKRRKDKDKKTREAKRAKRTDTHTTSGAT